MNIKEIDKPEIKKIVVVYSGRFQPFHKGHYTTYQKLVSKFGANNVYVGTSNDTSGPKSPFNFQEKKTIMTKMFGISPNKIVQVKNPYAPKEILNGMDGKTTAYIAAVGEKDADRLAGKYFKPYKGKAGYGYDEIGYVYAVPAEANPISGTDVRSWLGKDNKDKEKGFLKAYPKFDKAIFSMITGKLNEELDKGYPSEKQVKDIERKNKEFRNSAESTSDDEYLYDPIAELIGRAAMEEMFEQFTREYFKEETEAEKMGLIHLGGGYYGKEGQPATHKSDNGKIRTLSPAEVDAVKKKSMAKGPSDAPVNEPKPSQPGQPVNKGATAQGKVDKAKEEPTADKKGGADAGKQAPPPEQKLSGVELKSSAEMTDADKKKAEVKEKLHHAMADLSEDEKKAAEDTNNPESETRKGWYEKLNDWTGDKLHKIGKAVGHVIAHKVDQYKEFGKGMYSIATSGKLGTIRDEETGKKVHWTDFTDSTDDSGVIDKLKYGSSKMRDVPVYKKDSHGHDVHDEEGNPVQAKDFRGRPKTQKEPVFREDLSPRELALAKKSWYERQEQLKGIKGTAMDAAVMCASMAVAGAGVGALAAKGIGTTANVTAYAGQTIGQAATHGAASAFTHGALGFSTHLGKDMVKHVAFESVGAGALQAGGGGAVLSVVTGGILEAIDDKSNQPNPQDMMMKLIKKIGERMGTYKMTDEQMLASIESYKKNKPESDLKNAAMDLMKENISETKQQSIQNFVEFATKRLKLKETPNITLVGGREFAEVKTSLGGYNPDDKSIYVATEGRLTADILRTLAHEMAHRKQDEMGLVTNAETDGADGSPIENKAHAVAGILMREYGRINKQIYNEDVNVDVDKGDTVLMGKFKNKKVQVKDIGKDQHGMPTINGKQATTFRIPRGDEKNSQSVFNEKISAHTYDSGTEGEEDFTKHHATSMYAPDMGHGAEPDTYDFDDLKDTKPGYQNPSQDKDVEDRGYEPVKSLKEVGPNDWHFKAIMKMWDTAGPFGRKKIGAVVCNDPKADRNDVARKLRNYGYKEVTHVTDKLGLDEKKNLNELTQGLYAGKIKIGGQPVEIEVELLGADNKTKEFLTKVIHIDKKYQSKLPIGSTFKIPARIFRMPGGGWYKIKSSAFKESLNEGGAYGHMSHPFDDMDLTFGDLKNIIRGALTGNLELTREKTDGQALAISWKNGRLIAARNKSHLQNGGAGAMGIEDVASKFAGRGGLTDAYNFAMRDLTAAISGLSDAQRKKIFNEGQCFMNLEVIWPTSVNVIPYGQALLVFHNTTCYDEKGSAIAANQGAATMLAGMIKQVNADVQSKYTIQGPPVTELPKNEELSSKQTKYLTQLQKLQFQFQLSDKDGVSEYHQAWWEDFVNKSKVKLQKLEKEALVRRWAFGDKAFRLNTIADKDAQKWAIDNDKVNVAKQQKENVRQFEEIFLGVGADVLSFMGSVLTVNPDAAVRNMKDRLKSTADKVRGSGDPSKIAKLKMELSRLANIGGKDKIVPNEGIVFLYKGNTYKLTGTFAPLNQILGIFYE